jgi:hypothetical protein
VGDFTDEKKKKEITARKLIFVTSPSLAYLEKQVILKYKK